MSHNVKYSIGLLLRSLRELDVFSAKFDSLVLTMHKTLPTDWLTYIQNILQPSFVARNGLVMVSSRVRVRVRIRVKVGVSVMVRVSIRTSWVLNFALFHC